MFRIVFVCIVLIVGLCAQSEEKKRDSKFALYTDQDFFVPFTNEDRDYTMGFAFEWFYEEKSDFLLKIHDFLDKRIRPDARLHESLQKLYELGKHDPITSYMVGQTVFTPVDIGNKIPIYTDRPYASLLYFSHKRLYHDEKNTIIGSEFQLGILGLNIAREVQKWFHRELRHGVDDGRPDPEGWQYQISNGGEPTLKYKFSYGSLIYENPDRDNNLFTYDLALYGDFNLGYQTNMGAGFSIRFGHIGSPFWTVPFDPINRGTFVPTVEKGEWYLWGALGARVIGYDVLLQGQFKESKVRFTANEIERLVYSTGVGVSVGFDPEWIFLPSSMKFPQVNLSVNTKSSELKIPERRTHVWGGITIVCDL